MAEGAQKGVVGNLRARDNEDTAEDVDCAFAKCDGGADQVFRASCKTPGGPAGPGRQAIMLD